MLELTILTKRKLQSNLAEKLKLFAKVRFGKNNTNTIKDLTFNGLRHLIHVQLAFQVWFYRLISLAMLLLCVRMSFMRERERKEADFKKTLVSVEDPCPSTDSEEERLVIDDDDDGGAESGIPQLDGASDKKSRKKSLRSGKQLNPSEKKNASPSEVGGEAPSEVLLAEVIERIVYVCDCAFVASTRHDWTAWR